MGPLWTPLVPRSLNGRDGADAGIERGGWFGSMVSMRFLLLPLLATFLAAEEPVPTAKTEVAFANLKFDRPLCMIWPPDDTPRVMVVEQAGTIRVVKDPAAKDAPLFLDLRDGPL